MAKQESKHSKKALTSWAIANSPLLRLSGEVRNIIWRFAVTSDQPVVYTGTGVEEPSLLFTCHAIRKEARSIYHLENAVVCTGASYDTTSLLQYHLKMSSIGFREKMPMVFQENAKGTNWPNLKLWLERFHTRELALCPDWPHSYLAERCIIDVMFLTVERLWDHPWELVESLLEMQHRSLVALNSGWAA
nr:hypothetical protein B0A51_07202 [Rachicladosporium sp. CCFEE 5018]